MSDEEEEKSKTTKKEKVIGIDLGTTNSVVSVMEGGEPHVIKTAEGDNLIPSVVHFDEDGNRSVGVVAKRQLISDSENTLAETKRDMGSEKKYTVPNVPDKEFTPQEIGAFVLQKAKADAEAYLGEEVKKAVVTVPAYFSDAQRKATRDAGKIAGLQVERIVAEPTAAALAYGLDQKEEQTILVFDLGGGTYDVSILEIDEGIVEVQATSGNNRLGGADFDEAIVEWLIDEFKKENGVDLSKDDSAMQRLKDAAEKAKIELSSVKKSNINLPYITANESGPLHLNMDLTRAKFNDLTSEFVEATIGPMKRAMDDAEVTKDDIDKVLLVGGSTRIPAVQDAIKDVLQKDLTKEIDPDLVVAQGAAIQGAILAGEVDDVLLLDVTPLTLGIETLGGVMTPLIERNTTIPTQKTKTFSTAQDQQTSVEIHVLQGERAKAKDNISLGRFSLVGIPPAPRGVPKIDVTFDIDSNGIVHVSAKDQGTGQEQSIKIESQTSLTEEEIEEKIREAEKYEEEDEKIREEIEIRNQAEAMVYQFDDQMEQLGDALDESQVERLRSKKEAIEEALESEDIDQIKKAKDDFEETFSELSQEIYGQAGAGGAGAGPKGFDPENFDPSQFANMAGGPGGAGGAGAGPGGPGGAAGGQSGGSSQDSGDAYDVDYEVSDVDDEE